MVDEWIPDQCCGRVRDRDIVKAIAGYSGFDSDQIVATGNWGCGSFGGNSYYKFFQQLIAASRLTKNSLAYCLIGGSHGDNLEADLRSMSNALDTFGGLFDIVYSDATCLIAFVVGFSWFELPRKKRKSCSATVAARMYGEQAIEASNTLMLGSAINMKYALLLTGLAHDQQAANAFLTFLVITSYYY